jgi:hypothetical protein
MAWIIAIWGAGSGAPDTRTYLPLAYVATTSVHGLGAGAFWQLNCAVYFYKNKNKKIKLN